MIDPAAANWREAMIETLRPMAGLPVLLSGGMDSVAIVAGLVAMGRRPVCYTYRLRGVPSEDVAMAAQVTLAYDLPWMLVEIAADPAQIEHDVRAVLPVIRSGRKTAVECAVPMAYLASRLVDHGWDEAISGDPGIIEDNRRFAVGILTDGETEEWRAYRRQRLGRGDESDDASRAMRVVAAHYGVALRQPYAVDPLSAVGLDLPEAEINSPRQKGIALRAFPEFFGYPDHLRFWRRNKSLQSASGLRETYAAALLAPERNPRGHRAVVAVYRDMLRQETGLWT